jgi:hypothetical protein
LLKLAFRGIAEKRGSLMTEVLDIELDETLLELGFLVDYPSNGSVVEWIILGDCFQPCRLLEFCHVGMKDRTDRPR